MGRRDQPGVPPAGITVLLLLPALAFATGLLALYGMNLPITLDLEQILLFRVSLPIAQPLGLLSVAVVLQVTPVLAIEAIPLVLLLHVGILTALLTGAVERCARSPRLPRLLLALGLGFAFLAPLPGVYPYPNPVPALILLHPAGLIPTVEFYWHPLVRYGFLGAAYAFPLGAILLGSRRALPHLAPSLPPTVVPAFALPSGIFGGMLLVLFGDVRLQLVGLVLNALLMVTAVGLWALYYRPHIDRIRLPATPGWLERRLYGWRHPAALFVLLLVLLIVLTLLEPVDSRLEATAAGHHLQHLLLFTVGVVLGGIVYQQVLAFRRGRSTLGTIARGLYASNILMNRRGLPGLGVSAALLILWHVPFLWDLAVQDEVVHFLQHGSVIAAGSALAWSLPLLTSRAKYGALLGSLLTLSVLSLALWVAQTPIYTSYPLGQLSQLGMLHFLLGMPVTIYALGATGAAVLARAGSSEG